MAMMSYNPQRLIAIHDQRWSQLGDWRNRWEEMTFYVMPQMRSFTSQFNPGNRRQEQLIYDSTALQANERLATRLHEAFTNPGTNWFRMQFANRNLRDNDAAQEWLDESERRMVTAIQQSNFNMTMGQYYLDLGCLGTANVSCDEKVPEYPGEGNAGFNGLTFKALHMAGMSFGENPDGIIDQQFDKFEMTAEQLCVKFGDNAPKRAKDQLTEGKPDSRIHVLLARFRRHLQNRPPPGVLFPRERPWAEVWLNYSDKEMIYDGGTYEQAVFTGRWRRKSIDIMGYGPGERALPTVRSVNEAERLAFAAWGKNIDPPMKTTMNNVLGDVDLRSKGLTVVRRFDEFGQLDIQPDINYHLLELEDKRFQIRDIFMYHALELPAREQVGEMTAYEVAKRVEQIYRALGPAAVQTQADVLNGLINRVFSIMMRKGALPALPEGLEAEALNVQYVGPMGIAARATELEAMDRYVGDALQMAEAGQPQAMDNVDFDKAQRYKAEVTGVPHIIVRDKVEVKEIREERARAEEEARNAELAQQRSEALKNTSDAIGPENLAAGLAERAA